MIDLDQIELNILFIITNESRGFSCTCSSEGVMPTFKHKSSVLIDSYQHACTIRGLPRPPLWPLVTGKAMHPLHLFALWWGPMMTDLSQHPHQRLQGLDPPVCLEFGCLMTPRFRLDG
jgi:hypothetical protein